MFAGATTEYVSVWSEARCVRRCLLCDCGPECGAHAQRHAQHTRVTFDPQTLRGNIPDLSDESCSSAAPGTVAGA